MRFRRCALLPTRLAVSLGVAALFAFTAATPVVAQALDEHCLVNVLNQSAPVSPDGTWAIPNIPLEPGLFRVRATCVWNGQVVNGMSPLFDLGDDDALSNIPISFDDYIPPPVITRMVLIDDVLTVEGQTTQAIVSAVEPGGDIRDISRVGNGTFFSSSNSSIASVSQDGVVTAHKRGSAVIQARYEGRLVASEVLVLIAEDDDLDTMSNQFEALYGFDSSDPSDAGVDSDLDNLSNVEEYEGGTNPRLADTDGDELDDGDEIAIGTDPLLPDTDLDGIIDGKELVLGTDPLVADTDGDGVLDGVELQFGLDPLVANATTAVSGQVRDENNAPVAKASVAIYGELFVSTDVNGNFSFPAVPEKPGSALVVTAQQVANGQVRRASTGPLTANFGGLTSAGTLALVPVIGAVGGVVTSPANVPVQGANVTVIAGAEVRTAITDPAGAYVVEQLTAGPVVVQSTDPNSGLRAQATGTLPANGSVVVNVKLSPNGTVRGKILATDGSTAVGAGVQVAVSGPPQSTTNTDVFGEYRFGYLKLGSYVVNAEDGTGNRARSVANLNSTNQVFNANLAYLGRGTVIGTVETATGLKVSGATVKLNSNSVFGGSQTVTSASGGAFSFEGVFVGAFSVNANDPVSGLGGYVSDEISVQDDVVMVTIVLTPSGTVSGVVYESDGSTPVVGAEVKLSPSGKSAISDIGGVYTIPAVPLGTYQATATKPSNGDRGRVTVNVEIPDATTTADITLNGVGSVTVTVTDGANVPVAGAPVTVSGVTFWGGSWTGIADGQGQVTIANVLAGGFLASASDPQKLLAGSTSSTLLAGETAAVTVKLETAGVLTGTVYAPDGITPASNIKVRLKPTNRLFTTGTDGKYAFDLVAISKSPYSLEAFDTVGTQRATASGIALASQGQTVVTDLVLDGQGSVTGSVLNPDGSPAAGVQIQLQSSAVGAPKQYSTSTAVGSYQFNNVPKGPFQLVASQPALHLGGSAAGTIGFQGDVVSVDIQLFANQLPPPPNPPQPGDPGFSPAYGSPMASLFDANNFSFPIRASGVIADGTQSVFSGDNQANRGSDQMYVKVGGTTQLFYANSASLQSAGRQVFLTAAGPDGLQLTRQVYVPQDGYFARYLDTVTNNSAVPVTLSIELQNDYRTRTQVQGGFTFTYGQTVVTTSSQDTLFGGPLPDEWVVLDDNSDEDPFLTSNLPAVAHVYGDGFGAVPAAQSYQPSYSGEARAHIEHEFGSITLQPGEVASYLHFTVQQLSRVAAIEAAERLTMLPPEALAGLAQAERDAVVNFAMPADGIGTVPPLPPRSGEITGTVLEADFSTVVPNTPVRFRSNHILFGRTHTANANSAGAFAFKTSYNVYGSSLAIPVDSFQLTATHPISKQPATPTNGVFPGGGDNMTTADVVFSGTGWVTGIVSRTDGTVVSNGTVVLTAADVPNALSVPIGADGGFAFYGLPPGTATLIATLPIPDGSNLHGGTSATILEGVGVVAGITIEPAGIVTGVVTNGAGQPAVNVEVRIEGPSQFSRKKFSDTGGGFTFIDVPVGAFTLTAVEPFTKVTSSAPIAVQQDDTTTQNLQLIGVGSVRVEATYQNGQPAKNVNVQLIRAPIGNYYQNMGNTNFAGVLTVNNVPVGNYTVRMYNPQNSALVTTVNGTLAAHGDLAVVPIVIPVDQPPAVTITQPTAGVTVLQNSQLVAVATASDDLGVSKVEFYVDGVLKATDSFAPYSVSLTIPAPAVGNQVSLTAKAYDTGNNSTTSAAVLVTVNPDNVPPVVTITSPADGASFVEGTTFFVGATASDNVGVANVAFSFEGGTAVVDSSPAYGANLVIPPNFATANGGNTPGVISVVGTDLAGNPTLATRNIMVAVDQPPTISLVQGPANGSSPIEGTQVTLQASASDDVFGVAVDLFINGVLAQTRSNSPFTFQVTYPDVTAPTPLQFVMKARDTKGQITALPAIDVTVVEDLPPTVELIAPTEGASYTEGTLLSLDATASDDLGVVSVKFYADGGLIATRNSGPYTATWRLSSGTDGSNVTIEARATDTRDQVTSSSRHIVRLDDLVPPSAVAITSPSDGAIVSVGVSDVMIVIDTSGSTGDPAGGDIDNDGVPDNILKAEVLAAKQLLEFFDPDRTRVGVVRFSSGAFLSQALTNNFAAVNVALDAILASGPTGGTNFDAAMQVATDQLAGANSNPQALPVQIFLSDGSSSYPTTQVQRAVDGGVVVNTFAVGAGASTTILQQIAQATGGTMTPVIDPTELVEILPSILLFGVDGVLAAATATDDVAVRNVDFHLLSGDGAIDATATDSSEPWVRLIQLPPITQAVQATLTAEAFDFGDNSVVSAPINITILPAATQPQLSTLTPAIGKPGNTIQIRGKFLSPIPANNVVMFNGIQATVSSASKIQLNVVVPVGITSGPVTVAVGGVTSNGLLFTVDSDGDGLSDEDEGLLGTDPNDADSDDDGLTDGQEVNVYATNPLASDSDADGMPDGYEVQKGFDPNDAADAAFDPDSDNLTNVEEYQAGTNPFDNDSDNDTLLDGAEVKTHLTNPLAADTDGGGAHDGFEVTYALDPLDPADDVADADGDGLTAAQEQQYGTDPTNPDTDGDTLLDGAEVAAGTSPTNKDTDGDGLDDNVETVTDPKKYDTDGDGLSDGAEVNVHGTNPIVADTDGDLLSDGQEINVYGTNPLVQDTDGDGLTDGEEVLTYSTAPNNEDTDNDGYSDGDEVLLYGSDPNVPDTCKIPECDENGCTLVQDPDPFCCDTTILSVSFDSGSAEGFTFENTSPLSKWQPRTGAQFVSASTALYYGNPAQNNFANGSTSGRAISPEIALPLRDGNTLSFYVWMDTETSTTYDRLNVEVQNVTSGAISTVWTKAQYNAGGSYQQWRAQSVNLDAFKGQSIRLRWFFNTVDGTANGGQGAYVDNISVSQTCPCTDVAQCDDENLCTIDECLGEGGCVHSDASCDDDNDCTNDYCDLEVGCFNEPTGFQFCDDGDNCTYNDYCLNNVCNGGFPENCDDGDVCTTEYCDPDAYEGYGGCVYEYAPEGTPCDDGDMCSIDDQCYIESGCQAGDYLDCDDGDPCTDEYCDSDVGCVSYDTCDDGDSCTIDTCDPVEGGCSYEQKPEGGPCEDGDACTEGETCDEFGNCFGGLDVDCDDGDPCSEDFCDYDFGCINQSPCDDANPCTLDVCLPEGGCENTPSPDPSCCSVDVYVEGFDGEGSGFTFTNSSTQVGWQEIQDFEYVSANGSLYYGNPNTGNFDSGNTNFGDAESPVILLPDADGLTLRFWIWMDTEQGGSYDFTRLFVDVDGAPSVQVWTKTSYDALNAYGSWRAFSVDLDAWRGLSIQLRWNFDTSDGIANDGLGVFIDSISIQHDCVLIPCSDVLECADGDSCTDEACTDGYCEFALTDCSDGDQCTDDECDSGSGCANPNNVAPCEDGDPCTTGDSCLDGACISGGPTDCDDGEACTDDTCDSGAGGCLHDGTALEGTGCDDGSACTDSDTCAAGECLGAEVVCDDSDGCTFDICDPATGCVFSALCDDGNDCTTDSCTFDGEANCDFTPLASGTACSDDDECTDTDECDGFGACLGDAVVCDDGDLCTYDSCDSVLGCQTSDACDDEDVCTLDACDAGTGECSYSSNDGEPCDDDMPCTTDDVCDAEAGCLGTDICDDGDVCTLEYCSSETGECEFEGGAESGTPCDDGDLCTVGDSCDGDGFCDGFYICGGEN